MPQLDPLQPIFNAVSTLTGGLINDMQTLIVGAFVVLFIVIGIDYLMSVLKNVGVNNRLERARKLHDELGGMDRRSFEYDVARMRYRKALNSYFNSR